MVLSLYLPVGLLALFATSSSADFPYNPTRIFVTHGGSAAYLFSSPPSSSQIHLQLLNTSESIDISNPPLIDVEADLPVGGSPSTALVPVVNGDDLNLFAGGCEKDAAQTELWRFTPNKEEATGAWNEIPFISRNASAASQFLSSAFAFSPTSSQDDASFYMFGGMCPHDTSSSQENWTSTAAYNNNMIVISPDPSSPDSDAQVTYASSTLPSRGPPVAEAGMTITSLTPTYFNTTSTLVSRQQNFALIGGHTEEAFINMSQIALYALPEESWSFEDIQQPQGDETGVGSRSGSLEVEPRSGHTAVLTPEGDKIIMLGGWVGDVSTPAEPQLAILEIGQGFGGTGGWKWTIPSTSESPLGPGQGIYGHGAAMLNGDMMIVSGGYSISSRPSRVRRQEVSPPANTQMMLFNTTSHSFVSVYTNPGSAPVDGSAPDRSSGGALHTVSQKAGLGAGLVLGLSAIAGTVTFYIFYSRRLRQRRAIREKELRELALGADCFYASDLVGGGVDGRGAFGSDTRSASWGSRQEKQVFISGEGPPWSPVSGVGPMPHGGGAINGNGEREAERTGLLFDIPSPTRGLRRSVHPKGPSYSSLGVGAPGSSPFGPSAGNGEIHTIAEQDEESEGDGPSKWHQSSAVRKGYARPESGASDPFNDPPPRLSRSQSEMDRLQREREIKGWVDDWEAAGAAMDSGREYHSSLSSSKQEHNQHRSRSGSPEKSDRTNSNLSERSTMSSSSIQRSLLGSISRNVSMRSASGGYVLFANAAAAMTGRATLVNHPGPPSSTEGTIIGGVGREPSKRSTSLSFTSNVSSRHHHRGQGDRTDTFSSAHTSFGPSHPSEHESLLPGGPSPTRTGHSGHEDVFDTPPESPVKDRNASVSASVPVNANANANAPASAAKSGKKGLGWMGSVRRALVGGGGGGGGGGVGGSPGIGAGGGVKRRVEELESRNGGAGFDATKQRQAEMTEISRRRSYGTDGFNSASSPRRAVSASAALWRGKKGARDWDVDVAPSPAGPSLGSTSSAAAAAATSSTAAAAATTSSTATATAAASSPAAAPTAAEAGGRRGSGANVLRRKRRKPVANTVDDVDAGVNPDPDPDPDPSTDAEEWDVEAAAEKRLVQVMFTVPKEKLRVVNADQLSLLSKSDVDADVDIGSGEGPAGDKGRERGGDGDEEVG